MAEVDGEPTQGAHGNGVSRLRSIVIGVVRRLARWWWALGLIALAFWLALVIPRDLGALSLLQLAGTEELAASAIEQLGGADDARRVIWLNLGLLVPWIGMLASLAERVRRYYYSPVLERMAEPVIWAAGLALVAGVVRSTILLVLIPDLGSGWVKVSSAAGWATWMFIIVAVLYTVPITLARWLPSRNPLHWRLDTVTAADLADVGGSPRVELPVPPISAPASRRVGISVSGGGMRSAAFNLGGLQALDEEGIYGRAEYVAAVSGGSYIAGAYALARNGSPGASPPVFGRGSPEESHVRNRSMYLAPGPGGRVRLLGRLVLGITINVILIGLGVVVIGRGIGFFLSSYLMYPEIQSTGTFTIHPSTWLALGTLGAGVLACGLMGGYRRHQSEGSLETWFAAAGLLLTMTLLLLALHVVLPWTITEMPGLASRSLQEAGRASDDPAQGSGAAWWLSFGGAVALLAGAVRSVVAKNRSRFAVVVGGLIVPLLVLVGFLAAVNWAARDGFPSDPFGEGSGGLWWTVVAALALVVMIARSDLTTWSMHQFYKRRLASAFAVRRLDGRAVGIPYDDLAPISNLGGDTPELVVCAAANITDPDVTPPGRFALTFTYSSTEVGGPELGYVPTQDYESVLGAARGEDITVPAVVAMSGAAISPAMGKMGRGRRSIGSALALANVRLGVWMPNPRWVLARGEASPWREAPRATYLVKELAGRYTVQDKFLYVTDGGHWENLGLVELLRRGVTDVYCFDAAGDKAGEYSTLGQAIALARAELGVTISIDPTVMRPGEDGDRMAPQAHAVGDLEFPDGSRGRILFIKAALVDDAPWDVRAYAERTPEFPNQSTFDQLFEDDQFEAHRALGYHLTMKALHSDEWGRAVSSE